MWEQLTVGRWRQSRRVCAKTIHAATLFISQLSLTFPEFFDLSHGFIPRAVSGHVQAMNGRIGRSKRWEFASTLELLTDATLVGLPFAGVSGVVIGHLWTDEQTVRISQLAVHRLTTASPRTSAIGGGIRLHRRFLFAPYRLDVDGISCVDVGGRRNGQLIGVSWIGGTARVVHVRWRWTTPVGLLRTGSGSVDAGGFFEASRWRRSRSCRWCIAGARRAAEMTVTATLPTLSAPFARRLRQRRCRWNKYLQTLVLNNHFSVNRNDDLV